MYIVKYALHICKYIHTLAWICIDNLNFHNDFIFGFFFYPCKRIVLNRMKGILDQVDPDKPYAVTLVPNTVPVT